MKFPRMILPKQSTWKEGQIGLPTLGKPEGEEEPRWEPAGKPGNVGHQEGGERQ